MLLQLKVTIRQAFESNYRTLDFSGRGTEVSISLRTYNNSLYFSPIVESKIEPDILIEVDY